MVIVAVFTAVSLTSCGEEVVVPPVKTTTTFSADNGELSGTRTSMDADRWFYWTIGDKIWVNTGSSYVMSTGSNITGNKQPRAKFTLDGNYTGTQYDVLYTGYTGTFAKDTANTSSTTVTIADQQTQSAWNNGNHLAVSGDCGRARAYKQNNGTYHFSLEHQASYLVLYPYLNSSFSSGNYTLQKIEIYSDVGGSNIAGQFDFTFANGLAASPLAGTGKQAITLNCGDNFNLRTDIPSLDAPTTYNHCFVVIAPGTHTLTIKYTVKNSSNETVVFLEDIAATQFSPNTVYPRIYEMANPIDDKIITEEFYEAEMYYGWGMTTSPGGWMNNTTFDNSNTEATDGFWGETLAGAPYCKTPNYNAAAWYVMRGNIYYDNSVEWTLNKANGTQETRRGGWWVKKAANIPGFSRTSTGFTITAMTPILGRPDAAVRGQYFFLPEIGGANTPYWTSNSFSTVSDAQTTNYAHTIMLSKNSVVIQYSSKGVTRIAGTRHGGDPWFQ